MKMPVRILLAVLCAALIVALPLVVSSPNMLYEVKTELMNEEEDYDDEIDFGRLFLSAAYAEDADVDFEEEDLDAEENGSKSSGNTLPIDFSPAPAPKAELYTEDGYEDESITVKMEHREFDELTMIHIAYIQIADASQLRTGVYKPEKLASSKGYPVQVIARKYNPVIAINGDNYTNDPKKTTFEYRMGQMIRSKGNRKKDVLIIDDQGDFHLYIQSQGLEKGKTKDGKVSWKNAEDWEAETGLKLVNAFTFGPALVKDGELLQISDEYGYNPNGREPRAAIGQTGPLSYVLVIVEVKGDRFSGNCGLSQHKLAELMHELGCKQAFNLDGGNSAEMVFGDQIYRGMPSGSERDITDIIYFATAVPE